METVRGIYARKEDFGRIVGGRSTLYYLPKILNNVPVLKKTKNGKWKAVNDLYKSNKIGIGYRRSKNLADKGDPADYTLLWGETLKGNFRNFRTAL